MPYNLVEAGAAVGKSKSTVLRAIRRGDLSAARDEATGNWLIDPAELHRVYPPVAYGSGEPINGAPRDHNGTSPTAELRELRARLEAAELRFSDAQDQIADLRRRFDQESEERRQTAGRLAAAQERIAALLTDQRPAAPTKMPVRRRRWPWSQG